MARIRTIKPDFWTDEKLTECSMSARLLFIGLLNFADDRGNLARSAKKIKMQVFPADSIDCEPLIQELITQGVLSEYSVSGDKYLNIKGFLKHQVINRPTPSNIPDVDSVIPHGALNEPSVMEGNGMERKGIEEETKVSLSADKLPPCPRQTIVDLYHQALPELPAVRIVDDKTRGKAISNFWKFVLTSKKPDGERRAIDADAALAWTKAYFERASENDFLMGRSGQDGKHRNWKADLDFLMTAKGMKHVIERTEA